MQTDPLGYAAGMNLYAYVGGDPVNRTDPSGLGPCESTVNSQCQAFEFDGFGFRGIGSDGGGGGSRPCTRFTTIGDNGGGICTLVVDTTPFFPSPFFDRNFDGRGPGNAGPEGGGGRGGEDGDIDNKNLDEPKLLQALGNCALAQYGFGDERPGLTPFQGAKLASQLAAFPIPKRLAGLPVVGNASPFTNALNFASLKLGIHNVRIPGQQIRSFARSAIGSGRLFTVLGRLNVPVGAALFAFDVASIAVCTARES